MVWKVGEGDGYALLAALLAAHVGESLPAMERKEGGKPWFPSRPDLHFSVSHSGALALCALSDREVGADVELIRPRRERLPAYALDGEELDWYRARGGGWEWFYTLWTLKEARVKCTGQGLRRPPREISVPLLEPGETGDWDGFRFTALAGEVWRGALCEKLT